MCVYIDIDIYIDSYICIYACVCVPIHHTHSTLHGEYVFTYSYSVATGIRIVYSAWFPLCLAET